MTLLEQHRREFLRFLAGSPLLAQAFGQSNTATKAADILNVSEFEDLAHSKLPPAHWGYVSTGVDDDATLHANMAGYKRIELRPRRLVDVSNIDTSVELFGVKWEHPLFLCPVGGQRMFHPEGELGAARAAKATNTLQVLSTSTSIALEEVVKARGQAPWYQLYMPLKWEDTVKLVKRVEDAGCPVMAWTIDLLGGRNTETATRMARVDTRTCSSCHAVGGAGSTSGAAMGVARAAGHNPMLDGLGVGTNPPYATWEHLDRLRKLTKMKLLLKGIETREDARLAREHGVDGLMVSNHGGRATEDLRPTIESLPEVIDGVGNQIPVLVDGGVRRGTDVFKALALGARAVGIGRPYVYGLTSFGQEGVERAIDILNGELVRVMKQCGTPTIARITKEMVTPKPGA